MKKTLRQEIIALRENHPIAHKKEKETMIENHLVNLPEFKHAHTILLYASFRGEVSLRALKERYVKDKTLVLPKVDKRKNELKLYEIPDLHYLQKGFAGILEAPEHLRKVSPQEIELAIIPGVAFDTRGNRLGFGQGYYDRILKHLRCPIVATAFEFQILKKVPTETHDHPVDIIVTEKRIIHCKKS